MQRRTLFVALTAVAAATLGVGCTGLTTLDVDVSSQGTWPKDRKPGSYAIERLPSQQANAAEQERVEAAAVKSLEAAGFRRVAAEDADVLIQVGARVFEVASRNYFESPFRWRSDFWYYGGRRRPFFYGSGFSYANDLPDYLREVGVLIRDRRNQQIVYETRGTYLGRWSSDNLLPAMFEAAMKDFPLPALSPRTVTVAVPRV